MLIPSLHLFIKNSISIATTTYIIKLLKEFVAIAIKMEFFIKKSKGRKCGGRSRIHNTLFSSFVYQPCVLYLGTQVGLVAMFVERKVRYSALFTNLVRWHAGAVSFPLSDVILPQLDCPLSDIMFCLHSGITNLSLCKHWVTLCYPA